MESDLAAAALQAEADLADSVAPLFAETPCTMDDYCERFRPPLARFIDIAAGRRHTCGLLADGRVQCWGGSSFFNDFYSGDYSEGYTGTASSWTTNSIVRIDAQGGLTCGLRTDASLFCWTGEGSFPRGRPLSWEQPRPYESGSYIDFAATDSHACALDLDGRAECWPLHHWDEPLTAAPLSRLGNLSFTAIDAGSAHVCGLHRDQAIYCWGSNGTDQLNAPAGTSWVQISAGAGHTCALDADGKAACWGDDSFGQSNPPRHSTFSTLAAGELHTCGLRLDGTAECWGSDAEGQATPPDGAVFAELSSGALHTCGLAKTGEPRCWGTDAYGQATPPAALARFARLSTSSWSSSDQVVCGLHSDGLAQCWGHGWNSQLPVRDGARFAKIVAARDFACGLLLDGTAECWGFDDDGRSSPPSIQMITPAAPSGPAAGILGDLQARPVRLQALAATDTVTCGLTSEGHITCWGPYGSPSVEVEAQRDDSSEWWASETPTVRPPTDIEGQVFASIDATDGYFCAERFDGSHRCWGSSSFRRSLDIDARFVEVSASDRYTCGHRVDGSVQCWDAWNDAHFHASTERFSSVTAASTYACGRAASAFASCWTLHPELPVPDEAAAGGFTQLSDAGHHTCVLAPDGAVDCWGRNDSGEATPPAGRSYAQISAGGLEGHAGGDIHYHAHTCGVGKDGALDCWGDDRFGQSTPPAGGDFVKVAASGIHACALRTDGEIVCWGWGYGDGRAPPASHDYSDVVVGAGGGFWFPYETDDGEIVHSAHTCGLRLDGIVDCRGTTYSPNKPYNRYEPDSRSRFTSISSGRSHVCGVRTDGAIECWGIPAFIAY